jgi:hypothetical protein
VTQKHLGFFFESGPNIKLMSVASGSSIPAGKPQGHRALFLVSGEARFENQTFDPLSYFMFPSGEPHAAMEARIDTEFLVIGWAPQGQALPFEQF